MAQNINRILTRPLTRALLKTPLTANQVTLLGLGAGLLAGPFFGQDRYLANVVGALLFELYALLDNSDGDIARLKNQKSRLGGWLDVSSDWISHVWLYLWLVLWAKNYHPPLLCVSIGAWIGILISYSLGLFAHFRGFSLSPDTKSWKEYPTPTTLRGWIQLNNHNETFAFFVLVLMLLGLKIPFLWASAVGANIFWIRTLIAERRKFFPVPSSDII